MEEPSLCLYSGDTEDDLQYEIQQLSTSDLLEMYYLLLKYNQFEKQLLREIEYREQTGGKVLNHRQKSELKSILLEQ